MCSPDLQLTLCNKYFEGNKLVKDTSLLHMIYCHVHIYRPKLVQQTNKQKKS